MTVSARPSTTVGERRATLDDLIVTGAELLTLSIESGVTLARLAASLVPLAGPSSLNRSGDACCSIPEVDCPPRCVCQVRWQAGPKDTIGLSIRLRNGGKIKRSFSLAATPFIGAPGTAGEVQIAPRSVTLEPGYTAFVDAIYTVPDVRDGAYESEILVMGAYQQAICIRLDVDCKAKCGPGRGLCEVEQGEPPVRIRAHNWYDHFQCTEPCYTPQGARLTHRPATGCS